MIKLGVNTILYNGHPLREIVGNLKKIGYDGFEIAAVKSSCEHLDLSKWKEQKNEISEICEEFSMPILASEVASNDPARLELAFEAAAGLGIPIINIGPGGKSNVPEDMAAAIENTNHLAEMARGYGVVLCMKAHVGGVVFSTPTTLSMIEGVKNPAFGVDMDPSHIYRCGEEPEVALGLVIHAMKHVHIRDCVGRQQSPGTQFQQICGAGEINLRGYFEVLVNSGYNGPVNLEVIGPGLALADANIVAAQSYGYMNACLKAFGAR